MQTIIWHDRLVVYCISRIKFAWINLRRLADKSGETVHQTGELCMNCRRSAPENSPATNRLTAGNVAQDDDTMNQFNRQHEGVGEVSPSGKRLLKCCIYIYEKPFKCCIIRETFKMLYIYIYIHIRETFKMLYYTRDLYIVVYIYWVENIRQHTHDRRYQGHKRIHVHKIVHCGGISVLQRYLKKKTIQQFINPLLAIGAAVGGWGYRVTPGLLTGVQPTQVYSPTRVAAALVWAVHTCMAWGDDSISECGVVKPLGVVLDSALSLEQQVSSIVRSSVLPHKVPQ